MSKPTFRAAALALAGILIAIGGCTENPSAANAYHFLRRSQNVRFDATGSATASAVIDARGGVLVTSAGDRITFPAGAVTQPTRITITSDPQYAGVELQPHGLTFTPGREPTLQLSTANTDAATYGSLGVAYVDDSNAVQEVLPAVTVASNLVTNLHHFSRYLSTGS
jgi:hypothetical protein